MRTNYHTLPAQARRILAAKNKHHLAFGHDDPGQMSMIVTIVSKRRACLEIKVFSGPANDRPEK